MLLQLWVALVELGVYNLIFKMDITYKTINGVRYAFATYKNETFQTMAENTSEEQIQDMFANLKRIIDEKYETLNTTNKNIEESRNQQEHLVLVDLKDPIIPVGEI